MTLEEAAAEWAVQWGGDEIYEHQTYGIPGFLAGAAFQEAKDEKLIEHLANILEMVDALDVLPKGGLCVHELRDALAKIRGEK